MILEASGTVILPNLTRSSFIKSSTGITFATAGKISGNTFISPNFSSPQGVELYDCIFAVSNFTDCGYCYASRSVFTVAVESVLFNAPPSDSQFNWSSPTWPAWDAAQSAFAESLLAAGIDTPPQPGDYPSYSQFLSYGTGLWDTDRYGIGAMDFPTATTTTEAPGPVIDTQPTDQKVVIDNTLNLLVEAHGTGTLAYAWKQNGSPVGTDSSAYQKAGFASADRGIYNVTVTNADSTVVSNDATVSVMPYITVQPASQAFTRGSTALVPVGLIGYGPTYEWYKTGELLPVSTGNPLNLTPFADSSRGVYKVVIFDDGNDTTSNDATIIEQPAITVQPVSHYVVVGTPTSLGVTATGYSLTYQWIKDGTSIGDATNQSYSIANYTDSSSGTYKVAVYSDGLDTTSSDATLASQITITSTPAKVAAEATPYSYQPIVTGHVTDYWSLTGAPADMIFSTTTGLIQWTPVDRTNSGTLHLGAYDTNGSSTTQDWTVAVIYTDPVITSTPGSTAYQNTPYFYNPTVIEAYVTYWELTGAPANMQFDSTNGTINWVPSLDQTSSGPLILTVHDLGDKTDSQSFTVTVISSDPIVKHFGGGPGQRKIILDEVLSEKFGRPWGTMADYPYQP